MDVARGFVFLISLAWLSACVSHEFSLQVTVVSSNESPLERAIVAVTCRLSATVDGSAEATDSAGLATITFLQPGDESRELSQCELTVAAEGYLTHQQPIELCTDDERRDDCALQVTLVEAPR